MNAATTHHELHTDRLNYVAARVAKESEALRAARKKFGAKPRCAVRKAAMYAAQDAYGIAASTAENEWREANGYPLLTK